MPIGMVVGLGLGHIVLDGDLAPPPKKRGRSPPVCSHVCCGQTAEWIKMPLGTEVGLGSGDVVLDGDSAPPRKGHSSPLFSAHVYCGHGRPYQLLPSSCPQGYAIEHIGQQSLSTCIEVVPLLWPPYGIGQAIIFLPCGFYLSSSFVIFPSPNISGRRLDVYHTSTHGVALVRI